jgi:hypothetical protein
MVLIGVIESRHGERLKSCVPLLRGKLHADSTVTDEMARPIRHQLLACLKVLMRATRGIADGANDAPARASGYCRQID